MESIGNCKAWGHPDFYESENPNSPAVLILPGMSGER
jgi:hypothetical protein